MNFEKLDQPIRVVASSQRIAITNKEVLNSFNIVSGSPDLIRDFLRVTKNMAVEETKWTYKNYRQKIS